MTPGGAVWRLWIDSGGTFTDCVAVNPAGEVSRCKLLSTGAVRARLTKVVSTRRLILDPPSSFPPALLPGLSLKRIGHEETARVAGVEAPDGFTVELATPLRVDPATDLEVELSSGEEAPVLAARWVTATPLGAALPPLAVRLASTRGTNALLEGKGGKTAFFVTRGHADLLEIGNQQRPDLFALRIDKPQPLCEAVVEVPERLDAAGEVVEELDLEGIEGPAKSLLASGVRSAAVALLHSYRNPEPERRLGERLRRLGFAHVSLSSKLSRRVKILGRARTAVVDAYLSEVLEGYVESVRRDLAPRSLHLMTSAGGLAGAAVFRPKDSLLSGPAGGVLGAAAAGARSGGERLLAFDMGGTSTDVSRFDGTLEYRDETRVGDARLTSTSVAVDTVAAGGGSICRFDGRQLKVGPESAGASPGPACYGAGGPLTLTDVNLLLGRIEEGRFAFRVDRRAARAAAVDLLARMAEAEKGSPPAGLEEMLTGLLRIANELMAAAVRRTAVRKGFRPSDYWLVAFGGAGPQHACAVAELLGIGTVLVPADAALLSAVGLGAARLERFAVRQILAPCAEIEGRLPTLLDELEAEARRDLAGDGVAADRIQVVWRRAHLRFAGQEATLAVEIPARPATGFVAAGYRQRYRELFGYDAGDRGVEIERLEILVGAEPDATTYAAPEYDRPAAGSRVVERRLFAGGSWHRAWAIERTELVPETTRRKGPGLVLERHSVTVVEPGWSAAGDDAGAIVLRRDGHAG